MTALDDFDRLETTGLWRPEADAQRIEVYVSIGEAELVVQDKSGTALSHWSLPALRRRNPGQLPAIYAPSRKADEELEIAEPEMVDALDRVVTAVDRGRRRPGRLRRIMTGLAVGLFVGLGVMWLPGALRDHAANVMPVAKRQEIGTRMLSELTLLTGPPCETITGREALDQLRDRLFPTSPVRMAVLRDLPSPAYVLPGGLIVMSDSILVTQDDPDVAAGHVVAAVQTARMMPPLNRYLDDLPFLDLLRVMVSGEITDDTVTDHVEGLLLDGFPLASPEALQSGFATAQIAWPPYAEATGQPGLTGEEPPTALPPALDDTGWQFLREICDG